ncbi:MAG: DUF1699 family protein [Acidobacteriia bacterium]|nr:DUF1699 family protein [Terriglobia bacterium]
MSRGEHRPGYKRPRTGEPRRVHQHFWINTLPAKVRDRIKELRAEGKTWEEIAELSREFSPKRLAPSVLHRWFDVHVQQPARRPELGDIEKLASLIADRIFERLKELLPGRAA